MYILGINAYHADSAACLIKDGKLIAAIEEERIRRIKHWAGFPSESIKFCLGYAGIRIQDIDHIAISRDPKANYWKKVWFILKTRPSFGWLWNRFVNKRKVKGLEDEFGNVFNLKKSEIRNLKSKIWYVEHHRSHIASAFFVSPFKESALLSIDGMGDFTSTMWGKGKDNNFEVLGCINYPHSIGFFYTAITQYLGFNKFGDEYKIMGLAAFGKPNFMKEMKEIVRLEPDGPPLSGAEGLFKLNLDYFLHNKGEVNMAWEGGYPELSQLYSNKLELLLGSARKENEELSDKHKDIAASAQALYEEVFINILNKLYKETKCTNLCFAGGTAQNSLANGKIFTHSPFKEAFIQPAGYDAGGALGAAYFVWNQILGKERSFETSDALRSDVQESDRRPILRDPMSEGKKSIFGTSDLGSSDIKALDLPFVMTHSFWGPEYHLAEIETVLKKNNLTYRVLEEIELFKETAKHLANGEVIGWFQGRTEWGPRALGNRSILANPARSDMKDILNLKIKKREVFRPFAPSILEEYVGEYFIQTYPVPFMEKVYEIKPEMRLKIPAVTHADGTGRLQTVSKKDNPIYWKLIDAFREITGVPMLLNTSFNENEPIVNKPQEAIDCFLRTQMDILVLGNCIISRKS
ncbi:MAG: carbamoyltransferase C-terminal domain-containing protein [bacterium]|nr:carbamoyltransferase C-terminal domain-containing protein [bacterium]